MGKILGNLMELCYKRRWNHSKAVMRNHCTKELKNLGNATSVHPKSVQSDELTKFLACSQLLMN